MNSAGLSSAEGSGACSSASRSATKVPLPTRVTTTPARLERAERLPHGWPADSEPGGELPLGGKPRARPEVAAEDLDEQLVGDRLVRARLGAEELVGPRKPCGRVWIAHALRR